jgi:hypothetical protein
MGDMGVLNVRITSLWKLWQDNYDVSSTFKITNQHGLALRFGNIAYLNFESLASKGPASICAERLYIFLWNISDMLVSHSISTF